MAASCYQIGAIRPDEYERCIDLVARAFTTNNPSTVHTEISFETFRAFALEDCTRAACVDTGLSLAARDSATGQVLAVMFLKTFALHQPPEKMFAESSGLAVSKEMYEALYEDAAVMVPCFTKCPSEYKVGGVHSCSIQLTYWHSLTRLVW